MFVMTIRAICKERFTSFEHVLRNVEEKNATK